ncbi:MAG: phosphotransferase [Bacilli bacterium]
MIEETIFNTKSIVEVVKEKYDITITEIKKINRGSANLYSLNNNTYILKEFQSKYTKEEIDREIKIINHLKQDKLPVPEYIFTINNECSFIYKQKVITLQKFIDGYTMNSNSANYEQMIESARELGKIIKSLETLDIKLPINDASSWYTPKALNKSIEKHKDLLKKANGKYKKKIIQDLNDKISILKYIMNNFNVDEMKNLTLKNTHGDYSVLQFIYKEGKIKAIIDFVSACKMPVAWEVIRSYSYIDKNSKNGKINIGHLVAYVKEFTKYVELNEFDIKYMPHLYLMQLLSSTYGYKQYILNNSKKELLDFAFFRTKLCKYLFKNSNVISKRLEKELLQGK